MGIRLLVPERHCFLRVPLVLSHLLFWRDPLSLKEKGLRVTSFLTLNAPEFSLSTLSITWSLLIPIYYKKTYKGALIPMLLKVFCTTESEGIFPNSFERATITPILKLYNDSSTNRKLYTSNFYINKWKIINKVFTNSVQ